jgi:Cation transporter/ATPase, N-terminus
MAAASINCSLKQESWNPSPLLCGLLFPIHWKPEKSCHTTAVNQTSPFTILWEKIIPGVMNNPNVVAPRVSQILVTLLDLFSLLFLALFQQFCLWVAESRENRAADKLIMEDAHARTVDEVVTYFNLDTDKGLSPDQVKRNQEKYGLNGKFKFNFFQSLICIVKWLIGKFHVH